MSELVSLDAIVKRLGNQFVQIWEDDKYISMAVHDLGGKTLDFLRQQKLKLILIEQGCGYKFTTIYLEFEKLPSRLAFEYMLNKNKAEVE